MCRPDKLSFEDGPSTRPKWSNAAHFPSGPCPIRYFIYRAIDWPQVGFVPHERCQRGRKRCDPLDELARPNVDEVRPAVMANVPRDRGPSRVGGVQHWQKARPIVFAWSLFNEIPPHAVACAVHPALPKGQVIVFGEFRMTSRGKKVQTVSVCAPVSRAFKTANEEARERGGKIHVQPH